MPVVHVSSGFVQFTPNCVYIGRDYGGYKDEGLGNPFHLGKDGNRKEVLEKYEAYARKRIESDPVFREKVKALKGKTLGCWCKPYACHGDVLARLADELCDLR